MGLMGLLLLFFINTLFIVGIYIVVLLNLNEKLQVKKLKRNSRLVKTKMYGVVVSMFDFHRSDRGSKPGGGGEKFHDVYDYTIEWHPWQVSENHKPRVHPSHVREIG